MFALFQDRLDRAGNLKGRIVKSRLAIASHRPPQGLGALFACAAAMSVHRDEDRSVNSGEGSA